MKRQRIYMYFLAVLFSVNIVSAYEKYMPRVEDPIIERWRWRHFSELDGKGVRCMVEDKNQNMWFGMDKGIIKYDGLIWKNYNIDDGVNGLPVLALTSTSDGRMIAGSKGGLSVFENNKWKPLFPDTAMSSLMVKCVVELDDGSILCGTNYGIIHVLKSVITLYTNKEGVERFKDILSPDYLVILKDKYMVGSEVNVSSLIQGGEGAIWIAMGYDNGQSGKILTTRLSTDGKLQNFKVIHNEGSNKFFNGAHLFQSASGEVWNVTEQFNQGLTIFHKGGKSTKMLSNTFGGDNIYTSILQVSDGTIFVGGFGRFYTLKNNKWEVYKAPLVPVPTSNRILFYEDSRGDIWLAGKQNEVFLVEYTMKNWATYPGLNYQAQSTGDCKCRWFIDIKGRVVKNEDDSWTSFGEADGLMSSPVRVYVTRKGQIWASGSHRGVASVAYFENNRWERTLFPKVSWGMDMRGLLEAYDGSLWFGCNVDIKTEKGHRGGVIRYPDPVNNKDHYIHYPLPQKEAGVYGMGQAKDKTIWVGGNSACYFDGEKWYAVEDPKEFKYHTDAMFTSSDSILWVGSRNYGLFRYDGHEWLNFTMDNGLNSNSITNIYADSDSLVWVATAKSISRYDGSSWSNNVFPPQLNILKEGGSINMDRAGNLWLNKSVRGWYRRALKGASQNKFSEAEFRTVFYHPDKLAPKTKLVRFEEEVSPIGNTTISWTGIDPYTKTSTEELQYSFRLDDNEWTAFSKETSHFFSELGSGDHHLEVRARDMDFNIDPAPLKIEFTVLYPFYMRPGFLIPILILTALSVFLMMRVVRRGKQLRQAKKETDDILRNIEQGLFLIDHDYKLSSQYSEFLKGVFNEEDMTNKSLIELLTGKVSAKDIESTESFLNIMFKLDTDQQMLDELNPLSEVKFEYKSDSHPRYFSFRFRRTQSVSGEQINQNLIAVVQDITEKITLGEKLEKAQEEADRKMNWLLSILHVEPGLLQEFLSSAESEILSISDILENVGTKKDPKECLESIYRSMHLLKGNAGLLSLNVFADLAHKYEDIISEMQEKDKHSAEDIKLLKDELEKISTSIHEVNGLLDRIGTIHTQMRTKRGYEKKQMQQSFENLVDQIAKDEAKKAKLISDNFQLHDLPYKNQLLIREVLVQLIKNSVAHGIESSEVRKGLNKNEKGQIEISSFKNDLEFGIKVRDDGKGVDIDKLKAKGLESGKFSQEEIDGWSDEQTVMSIFDSGVSTAEKINMTSGRGVGLNAVKEKVESVGGKISVDYKKDEFCQFTIVFLAEKE